MASTPPSDPLPPPQQCIRTRPLHNRKLVFHCCACTYQSSLYDITPTTRCPVISCRHTLCDTCTLERSTRTWRCWGCRWPALPMDRSNVSCLYCRAQRDSSCPVEWFTLGFAFQWGADWVDTGRIFLHGDDAVRLKFDKEDLKVNFKRWQKRLLAEEEERDKREERLVRGLDHLDSTGDGASDGDAMEREEDGRRMVTIN